MNFQLNLHCIYSFICTFLSLLFAYSYIRLLSFGDAVDALPTPLLFVAIRARIYIYAHYSVTPL
jgi:hypothetical protein